MSTRPFRRAKTGLDREKFDVPAAFGKGSGRTWNVLGGTLKTLTGGLENPDGRSRRAQAELGAICRLETLTALVLNDHAYDKLTLKEESHGARSTPYRHRT
jgi:hypothetical protein